LESARIALVAVPTGTARGARIALDTHRALEARCAPRATGAICASVARGAPVATDAILAPVAIDAIDAIGAIREGFQGGFRHRLGAEVFNFGDISEFVSHMTSLMRVSYALFCDAKGFFCVYLQHLALRYATLMR